VKPGRIYAGQAGATKWPSGKAGGATLRRRISSQHLGGNVRGSTFRLTLAAVLADELQLPLMGPRNITRVGESRLSHWIGEHLAVAVYPFEERDALADLEHRVLVELNPPLNL
jgi:GIY-YIG catalytic domain-containing protein